MNVSDMRMIYINLGEECNFSCKYCSQKALITEAAIHKGEDVADKVVNFLQDISEFRNSSSRLRIRFTGGEPLIYFDKLKQIVERVNRDYEWIVITNGSLITDEQIEFFNRYDFHVGISNDGPNTELTRSVNLLEDSKFLERIAKIKNLRFVCVLTAYNANYKEVLSYFKEKLLPYGKVPYVSLNPVYDTGSIEEELIRFDWEAFEQSTRHFFDSITLETFSNDTPERYLLIRYLNRVLEYFNNPTMLEYTGCGADYDTLSMDSIGNVFACHNTSIKIGDLGTPLEELQAYFKSKKDFSRHLSENCVSCYGRIICGGSCPFVGEQSRKLYYCRLHKTIIENVLNTLVRLGMCCHE